MVFGRKKKEKAIAEAVERERRESAQLRQIQDEEHRRETENLRNQRRIAAEEHRTLEEIHRRQTEQYETQRKQEAVKAAKRQREKIANEQRRLERERERIARQKMITPEALRELRDLIRTRYQLDVEIWSLKGTRGPNRPIVITKMEKADDILMEIYTRVEFWEASASLWTEDEWKVAQQIKQRIQLDGKKMWNGQGPWNER
ncbi:hypothetical protein DL98DRAFT_590325 [Cadophora sp. DSE1049]|nr:hypothetical protein DL98DRAFT_590325 [Cadophora sp. DSE1049]